MEFSNEEMELLRDILETARADLKEEINKTEDTDYRAMLRRRRAVLDSILAKLSRTGAPGPG